MTKHQCGNVGWFKCHEIKTINIGWRKCQQSKLTYINHKLDCFTFIIQGIINCHQLMDFCKMSISIIEVVTFVWCPLSLLTGWLIMELSGWHCGKSERGKNLKIITTFPAGLLFHTEEGFQKNKFILYWYKWGGNQAHPRLQLLMFVGAFEWKVRWNTILHTSISGSPDMNWWNISKPKSQSP